MTDTATAAITLTDKAAEKIGELLGGQSESGEQALRVAVRGGGCSGFQYALAFDKPKEDDNVFEVDGVAVVVEQYDEGNKIPRIDVLIHVDKESHKGIVIGSGGQALKAIGTEARARVEGLLGTQVNLQLRVRVTPKWYESDAKLGDLGYGGGNQS